MRCLPHTGLTGLLRHLQRLVGWGWLALVLTVFSSAIFSQTNGCGPNGCPPGTPGGSNNQVQYNSAGSFGGISNATAGFVLTSNGATLLPTFQAVSGTGTVTNVATGTGLTGGPITTTGTVALITPVAVANGGTGTTTSTGTGSLVLANSPVLTTPNLGTPSTLVLTNAAGLPTTALPTFGGDCTTPGSSAVLTCTKTSGVAFGPAATVATTTGSGSIVLATSPTLTTPNLGTPTTIGLGNATGLPYSALPTQSSSTVLGNASGSTAVPSAVNPLALANMQAAVINASVVATTNITLSGAQTIDGVSIGTGQTVLVVGQTTSSQNGIYISASGAWTRAVNFPSGFVIAQNCDLVVYIHNGFTHLNSSYALVTTGGSITIGTTAQTWLTLQSPSATSTLKGLVKITFGDLASGVSNAPFAVGDCPAFTDTLGSVGDIGFGPALSIGPCSTLDTHGHVIVQNNTPAVTGAGCSLVAGGTDTSGSITATGINTCTLTFGATFDTAPHCAVGSIGALVVARLNAQPTAASAVFATAAAGSFDYLCF